MRKKELWYKKLPEHIRDKAIYNMIEAKDKPHQSSLVKKDKTDTLVEAIDYGFVWQESKEGFAYWAIIYDNLYHLSVRGKLNKETLKNIEKQQEGVDYERLTNFLKMKQKHNYEEYRIMV